MSVPENHFELNVQRLARVSAWRNNCGLGCFSNYFTQKLLSNDLIFKDRFVNPKNVFYNEYQNILKSFKDYYGIAISVEQLKHFLSQYENPLDHEAILSPILRSCLSQSLWDAKTCWDTIPKVREWAEAYFRSGKISEMSRSTLGANRQAFEDLRNQHKNDLGAYMQAAEGFWIGTGYEQYKKQLGNAARTEMISDEELTRFGSKLGIEVVIYNLVESQFILIPVQREESKQDTADLFLVNQGNHWEYMTTSEEAAKKHNAFHIKSILKPEDSGVFSITKPFRMWDEIRNDVQKALNTLGQLESMPKKPDTKNDEELARLLARQLQTEQDESFLVLHLANEQDSEFAARLAKEEQEDASRALAQKLTEDEAARAKPHRKP